MEGFLVTPTGGPGRLWRGRTAILLIAILVVAVGAETSVIAIMSTVRSSTSSSRSISSAVTGVSAGTWAPTSSMIVATSFSGVATLPDGRVLVAGGYIGAGTPAVISSSQIYDPSTGKWSAAASMHYPRAGFIAVLLDDGDVLAAGGEQAEGNVTNTAEIYNPSSNSWTMTGSMNFPRLDYQAVLLNDGRVFVEGGSLLNGTSVAEIYNPSTGNWTLTPPQPFPRQDTLAVKLNDGDVLVAGGESATASTTLSEIYDPTTNTWTQTGSLNEARSSGSGVLLTDGDVLFTGGQIIYNDSANSVDFLYTAELYNVTTSQWTLTGDMASPRGSMDLATVLLDNGEVLVPGGNYQPETGQSSAELYYPKTGIWGPAGDMSVPRGSGEMAVLLKDGDVLVFGGLLPHPCPYCGAIALRGLDAATASADIYTPG